VCVPDDVVIRQGDEGDKFYVILSGAVDIFVQRDLARGVAGVAPLPAYLKQRDDAAATAQALAAKEAETSKAAQRARRLSMVGDAADATATAAAKALAAALAEEGHRNGGKKGNTNTAMVTAARRSSMVAAQDAAAAAAAATAAAAHAEVVAAAPPSSPSQYSSLAQKAPRNNDSMMRGAGLGELSATND
jgi:CRP-like cAMP-binding protein